MQTLSVERFVGQVVGNYHVESFLGRGRLNAVYLAQNLASRRIDALTLYIPPEQFSSETHSRFILRFLKEAAAVSTLRHAHILPIYEYGEWSGYPYLVTPYMTNGSLADILKQQKRCDHQYVLEILEQVAAGLAYAHGNGLVHGTLKPSNIILSNENTMQVAGFGLLHMLQMRGIVANEQPYAHLLSIANTFLAAPEYIAPEVVQGEEADMRSDMYALGAILFELLSGQPPFTGTNPLEIAQQHVQQAIPSLRKLSPDVPIALESVLNQALAYPPARRFQHASDLVEAFAQVSNGATGQLPRVTAGENRVHTDEVKISSLLPGRDVGLENKGGSWQLLPPIVTGKVPAITMLGQPASEPAAAGTGSWQLVPPIVTVQLPVVKAPEVIPQSPKPTITPSGGTVGSPGSWQLLPPIVTGQYPAVKAPPQSGQRVVMPPSKGIQRPYENAAQTLAKAASDKPVPTRQKSDAGGMKPFDWWSMPGQVDEAALAEQPRAQAYQPVAEPQQVRQREQLNSAELVDWSAEPMQAVAGRHDKAVRAKKSKSGKLNRRQAVAILASGGVIAAGTALAVKMNLLHMMGSATNGQGLKNIGQPASEIQGTAQKSVTQPPKGGKPTPAANGNPPKPTQAAGHTGTVIGATNIPLNTPMDFTNPADGKASVLIHLPSGAFAAYETACTHEGVTVNYDPDTHLLVCPAHGAIFDPAKGGSVVQGPATRPITAVPIKVNADGTVTTG